MVDIEHLLGYGHNSCVPFIKFVAHRDIFVVANSVHTCIGACNH